jgi:hypothetical protein
MYNILVIHAADRYPMRATVREHLYSFQRYSGHNCFYLNLGACDLPSYIASIPFDLIVFHTTFLSTRWTPELFAQLRAKALPLKRMSAVKAALPQDEFIHTDVLSQFINEFNLDYVFTVAPESEWRDIYRDVDFDRTTFVQILTGYLDEKTVQRIERLARRAPTRKIDIGYRAWRAAPWLGRHGLLKVQIAEVMRAQAARVGLATDISTSDEATLLGDAWYEFLLRCKYTIGVEGGASILDRDGTIKLKTEAFLRSQPDASFDEIERACFPGLDGSFQLKALSPRNLEACATKTCQILIEGQYSGVLTAGEHYLELKRDFSNLDQVLELVRRDTERDRITENAYRDVVASGRYTYKKLVRTIIERCLDGSVVRQPTLARRAFAYLACRWMRVTDARVLFRLWLRNLRRRLRLRTRLRDTASRALPKAVFALFLQRRRTRNV